MNTDNKQVYTTDENGKAVLVSTETIEVPSIDDHIAQKEAKLLEMYAELEALKAQQNQ